MSSQHTAPGWTLTLPRGWTTEGSDDCTTFLGPQRIGALQVSAYRKDLPVTDDDLQDFAQEEILKGAASTRSAHGDFEGLHLVLAEEDRTWDRWYLRNGPRMLLVTYNRDLAAPGDEMNDVETILASLRTTVAPAE